MEVFIASPAYMKLKAEDQHGQNAHSKIWQSDTTTVFLDRGELVGVSSISDKKTTLNKRQLLSVKAFLESK